MAAFRLTQPLSFLPPLACNSDFGLRSFDSFFDSASSIFLFLRGFFLFEAQSNSCAVAALRHDALPDGHLRVGAVGRQVHDGPSDRKENTIINPQKIPI